MSHIDPIQLACGAVLVAQPIPNVASVAMDWRLPVGSATDPEDGDGQAAMLAEMIFRGAAGMSSREHSDALDRLGVQRSSRTLTHHLQIGATLLADRVDDALPLLASLVRRPNLPDDAVDAVRSLCLQALEGLDDDPQHLVMLRLRQRHMAAPFNRHGYGRAEVLERTTGEDLRDEWERRCRPHGAIFTAAGAVDPARLAAGLDQQLEGFTGGGAEPVRGAAALRGVEHVERDTSQVHIGLACDAPREADEDSMLERLALAVLSGSSGCRLFTEVRQKRSLCYAVGAAYRSGRDEGLVTLYAGSTPEHAQETLDVSLAEFERLGEGAELEEFERAVIGLKSHLIMRGESTPARAAELGSDQFRLGRARTLDEIAGAIDAITLDDLNRYLAGRTFGPFTLVTVGPEPVSLTGPATLATEPSARS